MTVLLLYLYWVSLCGRFLGVVIVLVVLLSRVVCRGFLRVSLLWRMMLW